LIPVSNLVPGAVAGDSVISAAVRSRDICILAVLAIDIAADQPAYGAAHQDVGGEVLAGEDSGEAYATVAEDQAMML
jgi:hypothetical protein